MSETLQPMVTIVDQQQLAEQLLAEAKACGIERSAAMGYSGIDEECAGDRARCGDD